MERKTLIALACFFTVLLVGASVYGRSKYYRHSGHRGGHPYYRHRYYYRRPYYPFYFVFPFVTIYGQRDYYNYGEVYESPPPLKRETIPRRPGREYVWVPGNWTWDDGWVWAEGEWVYPPQPGAQWEPGYWSRTQRGWVWVQGYWR